MLYIEPTAREFVGYAIVAVFGSAFLYVHVKVFVGAVRNWPEQGSKAEDIDDNDFSGF